LKKDHLGSKLTIWKYPHKKTSVHQTILAGNQQYNESDSPYLGSSKFSAMLSLSASLSFSRPRFCFSSCNAVTWSNKKTILDNQLGMRWFGDISIQYRYGGSRYVSWPSAIYRDTTLTFVIRGSHHVVSHVVFDEFLYSFKKYNLCGHCLCKMPVEMDL